ncbi:MAG: YraN family protein [Lachnospiraceae bacterium]|nr:YraN family protein [Lachnospiraceae bacterium]
MNKRALGSEMEARAAEFLQSRGVKLTERNLRCRAGEVDLVGIDRECLVFFEVKWRRSSYSGDPSEAVDLRKQNRICRVSDHYRMLHKKLALLQLRFDVIAMDEKEIHWIKNAFDYTGNGF